MRDRALVLTLLGTGARISELINLRVRSLSPHKLRHTYATSYLRNGGDVVSLQKTLGHSTLDMSRHYAQVADDDLERKMKQYSPVEALQVKV